MKQIKLVLVVSFIVLLMSNLAYAQNFDGNKEKRILALTFICTMGPRVSQNEIPTNNSTQCKPCNACGGGDWHDVNEIGINVVDKNKILPVCEVRNNCDLEKCSIKVTTTGYRKDNTYYVETWQPIAGKN